MISLLPAPTRPAKPSTSPLRTAKLTSSKTPFFVNPSTVITVSEPAEPKCDYMPSGFARPSCGRAPDGRLWPRLFVPMSAPSLTPSRRRRRGRFHPDDGRCRRWRRRSPSAGERSRRLSTSGRDSDDVSSSITTMRAFCETALTISTICCRAVGSRTGFKASRSSTARRSPRALFLDNLTVLEARLRRRLAPEEDVLRNREMSTRTIS